MTTPVIFSGLERRELLLQYIETHERATITEICEEFLVSPATVRRDLEALELSGHLRRFHGGALAVKSAPPEPPFATRSAMQEAEKQRIGQATAALIENGETLFLGSGTTVLEVARNLRQHRGLSIVTNSLLVMNMLAQVPEMTLVALGGILRSSEQSFIGHLTELTLSELHVNKVILGIRAIDLEAGITNDYLGETQTDRKILSIGREVILVADHTKCERVANVLLAPLSVIHTFVTDTQTPSEFTTALQEQGIRVLTA